MDKTEKILKDRPNVHGEFTENSRATWEIMRSLQRERNWPILPDPQKHALYMIAHKMARILAGDPSHEDHWDDIAGYARCVSDRLRQPIRPYDGGELYAALAIGWGVTRDEAQQRVHDIYGKQKSRISGATETAGNGGTPADTGGSPALKTSPSPTVNGRSGTPSDGGHHAAYSDDIEEAAQALRRELNVGKF